MADPYQIWSIAYFQVSSGRRGQAVWGRPELPAPGAGIRGGTNSVGPAYRTNQDIFLALCPQQCQKKVGHRLRKCSHLNVARSTAFSPQTANQDGLLRPAFFCVSFREEEG